MTSYRLFLWSREENRLQQKHIATAGADGAGLLEAFDHIGRSMLGGMRREGDPSTCPPRPSKIARARRHLIAARRLLEDMGEHMLAQRTAAPIAELERRDGDGDGSPLTACLLPRLPA
ncbi:hypothetical protein [Sphingomonas fennica]|uniref:Uncharacterized protein n=1 Tax=Edaphosphingomonas fennica TaxID=114404 RepID=A0A2T4HU30_9SPHN|nr:hypothetical protein [Sphingomonas fennica]PTD19318.1 hypothetical protein CV103_13210 [Sphingomonas fennica]